jgi:hypothetical protein
MSFDLHFRLANVRVAAPANQSAVPPWPCRRSPYTTFGQLPDTVEPPFNDG